MNTMLDDLQQRHTLEELQEMFVKRTHDPLFADIARSRYDRRIDRVDLPVDFLVWKGYELATDSKYLI